MSANATEPAPPASSPDVRVDSQAALAGILLVSLEALAASGQADAACRLAGRACAALRGRDAAGWQRFNAFLHRMIRHVS